MSKLTKLTMELETPEGQELIWQKASLLQGVMMEQLSAAYADELHLDGLKPYSQNVQIIKGKAVWEVNTLTDKAYEEIICSLLSESFTRFAFSHDKTECGIVGKNVSSVTTKEMIETYYLGECGRKINLNFTTPTAFRQNKTYVFYPDLRLIYSSLMNRFDAFEKEQSIYSEEVLEQLIQYTQVTGYHLRSRMFSLEGIKIPSFTGMLSLKLHGPSQLVNLVHLLLRYGEYSGVGIKTAIGMGKIQMSERGTEGDRQ